LRWKSPEILAANRKDGTTVQSIRVDELLNVEIPVPPVAEQRRIVESLEIILGKLSSCCDRLDRVSLILSRFRQAVLAAACSGRLTEDWRLDRAYNIPTTAEAEHASIQTPESIAFADIPVEWQWVAAGIGYTDAGYGTSVRCDGSERGTPVLRVPNIASGRLALDPIKYAPASTDLRRLILEEGDILICRTNGSLDLVGKAAVVPLLSHPHAFASYLIRLRVEPRIFIPEYLHLVLLSPVGRAQIADRARTTAGQFNLNLEILRGLAIPRPSLEEQREIVRQVNVLSQLADRVEQRVASISARTSRLSQSIFAKTFRGELVPTEAELAVKEGRKYETAEELLARIGEESITPLVNRTGRPDRIRQVKRERKQARGRQHARRET
jgi:type I restriction enzyme S subunit